MNLEKIAKTLAEEYKQLDINKSVILYNGNSHQMRKYLIKHLPTTNIVSLNSLDVDSLKQDFYYIIDCNLNNFNKYYKK